MVTCVRKVPLRRVWICGIPELEPFQVRVTALRPGKSLPTTEIVAPGAALLGVTVSCVRGARFRDDRTQQPHDKGQGDDRAATE